MRILYVTTVGGTMSFFPRLVGELIGDGHTVDIATNESLSPVPECYRKWGCAVYQISCTRSPLEKSTLKAVKEIKKIVSEGGYDIVHCHTPVAAMCTRLACRKLRKDGLKVFYTAHGFHFCKGAPLKNWLLYYPVEWICAWMTDVLITINEEDYALAKKHMHAKRVEYVPGVGIDLEKFAPGRISPEERKRIRAELEVGKDGKLLLSVGELNPNKNHEVVIRALAKISDRSVHYAIAGAGELRDYLVNLADELGVGERVHLLGYRNDTPELYAAADLYVHPSIREGFGMAPAEAIAEKIPVLCSHNRGSSEFVLDENTVNCYDVDGIAKKICDFLSKDMTENVEKNYERLRKFDISAVVPDMKALYGGGGVDYVYEIYRQQQLKKSVGVPVGASLIFSVGELNPNKNHEVVIRALARMSDRNVHYAIAGVGELREYLMNLADELGVGERVHLLGYRNDTAELYAAADLYVHPSLREGLPVALMEAIASKIPVICSDIRGNRDLVSPEQTFEPRNVQGLSFLITQLFMPGTIIDKGAMVEANYNGLLRFDLEEVISREIELLKLSISAQDKI